MYSTTILLQNDVIKSESHDNIFGAPKSVHSSELKRRASDVGVSPSLGSPPPLSNSSSSSSNHSTSVNSLSNSPVTLNFKYSQRQAPVKDTTVRKSKKVKPKNQPNAVGKQRPIKFHEYKVR